MDHRGMRLAGAAGLALLAVSHVHGHGAHEHGVAHLDIAVEGDSLQIEMTTPAANLLGFEHAPRDEGQREILGRAVAALEDADALFSFTADARCVLRDVTVLSPLLRGEEGHEELDGHEGHAHGPDEGHADFFVAWRFSCAAPAALRDVDARGLFERFRGMESARVQAVTAAGQTAGVVGAASSRIRF